METMKNSPSRVQLSVVLGLEQQIPISCSSGINLFVCLQLDSAESTQGTSLSSHTCSEGPWHCKNELHDSLSPQLLEESPHPNWEEKGDVVYVSREESRGEPHEERSATELAPRELDDDLYPPVVSSSQLAENETTWPLDKHSGKEKDADMASAPEVTTGKIDNNFVSPLVVQLGKPTCSNSSATIENFQMQEWKKSRRDDCRYSSVPQGVPMEIECESFVQRRDQDGQVQWLATKENLDESMDWNEDSENQYKDKSLEYQESYSCNENRSSSTEHESNTGFEGVWKQDCANLRSSTIPCPETEALGTILGQKTDPIPNVSASTCSSIECFNVAEISAACQLLEMSSHEWRKEFTEHEQAALKECDVYNLGFRGASNLEGLSKMVENIYATISEPGVKAHNAVDSDERDRNSDCEILSGRPRKSRKRQYKSMHDLVRA